MADAVAGILRAPTEQEKKDYVELGTLTPKEKFMIEISKVEFGFIKRHLPFDRNCAVIDFDDELERIQKESERVYGYVRKEDVQKLNFKNLERYGDANRFELIEDEEVFEQLIVNGTKSNIKTGHTMKYVCSRGHNFAVFVPNDIWEEKFGKKK